MDETAYSFLNGATDKVWWIVVLKNSGMPSPVWFTDSSTVIENLWLAINFVDTSTCQHESGQKSLYGSIFCVFTSYATSQT